MKVCLLLPLFLLHGVPLFCAVNGDNMTEENIGDTQAVTSRPTTIQNITTPQCDYCPIKTKYTTDRTAVLPTDHTTQEPSPPPSPTEYVVIGRSGVCLRIKAIFIVMQNITKSGNVTFSSLPITKVDGGCYGGKAQLGLEPPGGYLSLTFREDKTERLFYLGEVYVSIDEEDFFIYEDVNLKDLVTPLGHSFTSEEKIVRIDPDVSLVLLDVQVQAFTLDGDNFPGEYKLGIQAVISRPTTMKNITTPQCDNCPKKTEHHTTHRTNMLPTDHITQEPSPPPSPTEYVLVGKSGVCLKIKAIFILMLNINEIRNVTIPSPPTTKAEGSCFFSANLTLNFPEGHLRLKFEENEYNSSFSLEDIHIYIQDKEHNLTGIYEFQEALVTPLGHSFTREEVILRASPEVSLVLLDVNIQAFTRDSSNFGRDGESTFIIYDHEYKAVYQLLSILNKHWSVTILAPSIYTVVFLVALPLNIMAIVLFLVKMKVRKPAVVYMLNLATADILLISVLPFYIAYRFMGSNWIFGEGMCRFIMAAFYCNMYCSSLLMTSISVDRFLGIVYPMQSLSWRTVTRAWRVCGVIWVISLASNVPLLIQQQTRLMLDITVCHDYQHFGAHLDFNFTYFSTVFSLFNFLPLFITTFCYIRTIHSLSRSKFDGTHKRSRAIRLTVVVLCVFVLCFGPTNVLYLIHFQHVGRNYVRPLYIPYILSSSISSINCCLDPLIYYFASSECQTYVYSLLRWKKDYRPPVDKAQSPDRTSSAQLTKSGRVILIPSHPSPASI